MVTQSKSSMLPIPPQINKQAYEGETAAFSISHICKGLSSERFPLESLTAYQASFRLIYFYSRRTKVTRGVLVAWWAFISSRGILSHLEPALGQRRHSKPSPTSLHFSSCPRASCLVIKTLHSRSEVLSGGSTHNSCHLGGKASYS